MDKTLLWDIDTSGLDYQKLRGFIVGRVIERGRMSDFYACFDLYGGIDAVAQIAKNEVVGLSERGLQFMCNAFNIKKEETKCFIRKQLRKELLTS